MDAKRFADEMVDPTIAEFEREPSSRRRAFLACVTTFHLMDYIPKSSRQKYQRECPAFAAVDRYAHAFKHKSTGGDGPRSLNAGQVFERPAGRAGVMMLGVSRLGDTTGGVGVAGEDVPNLLDDVKKAAAFLRSKLPP
jgi:hypothetical protein